MTPTRASSSASSAAGLAATAATAAASLALIAAALSLAASARRLRLRASELERRLEELAAASPNVRPKTSSSSSSVKGGGGDRNDAITIRPIGTVTSPYRQRAGCPRQGLLAPHSRSHLVLDSEIPFEVVDGLERYSHVWVVFRFHLNPSPKGRSGGKAVKKGSGNKSNGGGNGNDGKGVRTWPTKVKPPRAGGLKLGVLSTRSPHRPNELGMSVGLLESVEIQKYFDRSANRTRRRAVVKLLGLDLVDGTPVLDIKPYVPWDGVTCITPEMKLDRRHIVTSVDEEGGPDEGNDVNKDTHAGTALGGVLRKLRVPPWVAADDELGSVSWTDDAREGVRCAVENGDLNPLYPPPPRRTVSNGNDDGDGDGDAENVMSEDEARRAITEVVAQDPRSAHEGRGTGDDAAPFEITFCSLRVAFRVVAPPSSSSDDDENNTKTGTNTNDNGRPRPVALIVSARPDPGDLDANPGSYQRNLYLRRSAEAEENSAGRSRPKWARPVREGDNERWALELEGGRVWNRISAC